MTKRLILWAVCAIALGCFTTGTAFNGVHVKVNEDADSFYEQLTFEKFVGLLQKMNKEAAEACGLKFIYQAVDDAAEEGDAGSSVNVYGWGVEKGQQLQFGYKLKPTSARACFFELQMDTSTQAFIYFKDKDDADRFFEKALAYGLVIMDGSYHIADRKLPNGTVTVDTFRDYNILAEISRPDYNEDSGFYVIAIAYFA